MNYYAVYQRDCEVLGIGNTEEEAMEDARERVEDFEYMKKQISEGNDPGSYGGFEMIKISEEAKKEIEKFGRSIGLEEDDDGIYTI